MSRPTQTERRRAQLALRIVSLEAMEPRSLITESLGILTVGIGVPAAVMAARPQASVGASANQALRQSAAVLASVTVQPSAVAPSSPVTSGGGMAQATPVAGNLLGAPVTAASSLKLVIPQPNVITVARAAAPASSAGGGGVGSSHGGSGAVTPAQPTASASSPAGSAGSANAGLASTGLLASLPPVTSSGGSSATHPATGAAHVAGGTTTSSAAHAPTGTSHGGGVVTPNALLSFANFPLYTLDYNAGSIFLPNTTRLATLGGNVDLRAQVENTTVSSYSWNTTGLTDATAIAGASTYDLTFQWASSVTTATTNSATLTVTNSTGQTQVQTYNFQVPSGTGTAGTGTATWPQSITPDTFDSAGYGAAITLPSYNPNVPAVSLTYDSLTANPLPLIVEHHAIDPAQAVPSQVSAQLTFNGTSGSTYYYTTSNLIPGDIQQIALQANATSLATGRYGYSLAIGDIRSSTTTTTVTGSADVINDAGSVFGSGWSVAGLETIVPATGGVILDLGGGGRSLWFANGSGSTYTDLASEFSTLVANTGGTYTRTFTDGTVLQFNSSGQEVADVDTNGVAITYGYDGSGRLSTIQDHYGNTTTFAYDATSGLLKTITDPASRIATFTHAGSSLSGVTLPDSSSWGYAYDGSGRLTQATDPDSHTTTVVYDSAGRVGTITSADGTSGTVVAAQERGFVPSGSGTSGSPAAATLLAQATTTAIDPLGNETDAYPDWQGLGLANVTSDPLGNVTSADRDGNGLATIAIDPLNRITQYSYDSKGNVTHTINADGTTTSATYNGFSEPLTATNERGYTTTSTYDSHANQLTMADPLSVTATMTYTGTGQLASTSNYGVASGLTGQPLPGGGPISYTYDSQDRMTAEENSLGDTITYGYDSAGDQTSVTDGNGHTMTMTYDALGRVLTTTDALGHTTTDVYDSAGNPTVLIDPLGHRTTTAYDAMNRVHTVTDADGGVTSYTYDSDGRQTSITDSVLNVTTYAYDADSRQVGSTDPNGYHTTLTFDADGEVTQQVDRDGHQINYAYDAMGRELTESWINGTVTLETITNTYNSAGELTQVTDGTTALTYTYDADDRQTGAGTSGSSGQPTVALTESYYQSGQEANLADNLSSVGRVSYSYDAGFRLTSLVASDSGSSQEIQFGYDAANNLKSVTRSQGSGGFGQSPSSVTTSYAYDAANRLTGISDQSSGGDDDSPTALDAQSYGYDAANRLTSETNAEGSVTYTYDNINELSGVTGARSESYSYDANGNRTMTGYTTATNNETTAGAGYTYTYDHDGNLTAKTQTSTGNVWSYTWDYRNRLTNVVETNSSHAVLMTGTYTYDPANRRIGVDETVSGTETKTWTVYDGVNPYADFSGSGTLLERYLYGPDANQILARTSASGVTAWYLSDHEGSVRDIVNTSGTVLDHIAYDSYGNVTSESSASNGDRFKFDGMAWDATIGLYYDSARYYDSTSGKFINEDPRGFLAGDSDLYCFTNNSPTDEVDPTGLQGIPPGVTNPILNNPGRVIQNYAVSTALTTAWDDSLPEAKGFHEVGGWIYYDPISGTHVTRPARVPGPNENGPNGEAPGQWTPLGNPPDLTKDGFRLIGAYHTHPFPSNVAKNRPSGRDLNIIINGNNYPTYVIGGSNLIYYVPPQAKYNDVVGYRPTGERAR